MRKRILVLVIFILYAFYNLVWIANAYYVYYPFTEKVSKHESGIYVYYDSKTNYTYNVKFPNYLSFTGNIGVVDDKGSGLIVWPGFFGKNYKYGFRISDGKKVYSMYVDDDMNLIDADDNLKTIFESNNDKMKKLWEEAHNLWKEELE